MGLSRTIQTLILKHLTAGDISYGYMADKNQVSYPEPDFTKSIQNRKLWVGLCTEKPSSTDTSVASELTVGTAGHGYHRLPLMVQEWRLSGHELAPGSSSTYKNVYSFNMEAFANKMCAPVLNETTGNMEVFNKEPVMFNKCEDDEGWGTEQHPVSYAIFFTEETGGTFIGWGKLKTPQVIEKDQVATFDVGELKLTFVDDEEE